MREYHSLYLKIDVRLLTDVFEIFRDFCLNDYEIDPCHKVAYLVLLFNLLHIKLELLQDYDMHLFIEEGIRGGVSMISTRDFKANNKYMKSFDD